MIRRKSRKEHRKTGGAADLHGIDRLILKRLALAWSALLTCADCEAMIFFLNARIFAIVDVFDALTTKRPYFKEPFVFNEAMRIEGAGSGSHFDPGLMETLRKIAPELYAEVGAEGGEQAVKKTDAAFARKILFLAS